ncbi:MAG: hypothetical protein IJR58_04695, partial [Lachnospiraceae bacterium]|nr:hypothetical protein [Lachnospiraceae bacterium]
MRVGMRSLACCALVQELNRCRIWADRVLQQVILKGAHCFKCAPVIFLCLVLSSCSGAATEETANGIVITDSATAGTVSSDAFAVNTTSSETDVADHPLYERINSVLKPRETFRVQNVLITQNGDNLTIQYDSRQMYNKDVFVTVKTTIRKLDPMPSEEDQFAMIEYFKERFPSFAGFRRWDRRFNRKYESVQERERNHFGHYYWDILADGYPTVFVYQGTAYEVFSEFEDQ